MKPFALLIVGVVVGWAASGVDWTREALGQDPPSAGSERSIRRERDGVLRRRGLLPSREDASPTPDTEAPAFNPNTTGEPMPYVPPGFDASRGPSLHVEPISSPTPSATTHGPLGRYQVSAYGWPGGHGCYIVDTLTGKTWHAVNGQRTEVVNEALDTLPSPNTAPGWVQPGPPTPTSQPVPSAIPTPEPSKPARMPEITPPAYPEPAIEESQAPAVN